MMTEFLTYDLKVAALNVLTNIVLRFECLYKCLL